MDEECEDNSTDGDSDFSSSGSSEFDEQTIEEDNDECDGRRTRPSIKEEKLSALGLCVGVGSFSDPWTIQGMAHFLEHMVFMGSEKYPKENDFDAFIKKRGGADNASTECEYTTFYFECPEKFLKEAIDRFSQFFISPLMKREAMTREREIIESEFQMAVSSDENRKQQLLCHLTKPECPMRKFTWGNLSTLRDNITDDELYEAVHEFRKTHYSAHRMTLAVQAEFPLEKLESWIVEYFSNVPNNGLAPDEFTNYTNSVFNRSEFSKIYWVKPVTDICEVELNWALPPLLHMYRSKPDDYLASLIGHEGKGSLLAYLRKKVWALNITSGSSKEGCEFNSMYTLFPITIMLTNDGLEHLREVLDAVFGYIRMLQTVGPSECYFQELQTIGETNFRFAEEVPADENVEDLSENMQFYVPEDYLTGSELFFEYDPEAIKKCLDCLKPDDVNIIVSSKDSGKEYDKIEPWFKTEYCVQDIPDDWRKLWLNIKPDPSFTIPEPNIFLTTDFSVLPFPEQQGEKDLYPVKVHDDELSEVWYRRDSMFKLPQAFLYYYLISPLPLTSPQNAAMLDLYVEIVKQLLVEEIYPADVANLSVSIMIADKGIMLKISGYNQKLHLLLEAVVNRMADVENSLTPSLFEALKKVQSRHYYNNSLDPGKLGRDLRLSVLMHVYWNAVNKHAAMSKIDMNMMKTFARHFVERLYIQSLVQGNISEQEAISACKRIVDILKCGPLLPNTLPQLRVSQIPLGEQYFRVKSFNSEDTNSFVTNYYQSGPVDIKNSCIVDLLMLLMEEPLFDVLRTKEQLGYDVYSTLRDTCGILGFTVTVNCQAGKHSVSHVNKRIEAFLKKFSNVLKKMRAKHFEEARNSLIQLKQLLDIHLKEEVTRNWSEISSGNYIFDRLKRDVSCLEALKLSELRKWYNDHVLCGNKSNFRKLSVQVVGNDVTSDKSATVQKQKMSPQPKVRKQSKSRQSLLLNDVYKCSSVNYGMPVELPVQFITEDVNGPSNTVFITDIEHFKNRLYIYPVNRICS
ncbi:nardilysin isoform X2 [Periplaneta americana]